MVCGTVAPLKLFVGCKLYADYEMLHKCAKSPENSLFMPCHIRCNGLSAYQTMRSEATLVIKNIIILCYFCSARAKGYFFPPCAQSLHRPSNVIIMFLCFVFCNILLGKITIIFAVGLLEQISCIFVENIQNKMYTSFRHHYKIWLHFLRRL